ncbi:Ragulator complex protein [Trichinella pseudospiralis]
MSWNLFDQKMNNLQKLQQHVVELASHVDQLHEVIFTDLDGVPILRCSIDSSAEMSIKTHFLASKALSAEKVFTYSLSCTADVDQHLLLFWAGVFLSTR